MKRLVVAGVIALAVLFTATAVQTPTLSPELLRSCPDLVSADKSLVARRHIGRETCDDFAVYRYEDNLLGMVWTQRDGQDEAFEEIDVKAIKTSAIRCAVPSAGTVGYTGLVTIWSIPAGKCGTKPPADAPFLTIALGIGVNQVCHFPGPLFCKKIDDLSLEKGLRVHAVFAAAVTKYTASAVAHYAREFKELVRDIFSK